MRTLITLILITVTMEASAGVNLDIINHVTEVLRENHFATDELSYHDNDKRLGSLTIGSYEEEGAKVKVKANYNGPADICDYEFEFDKQAKLINQFVICAE